MYVLCCFEWIWVFIYIFWVDVDKFYYDGCKWVFEIVLIRVMVIFIVRFGKLFFFRILVNVFFWVLDVFVVKGKIKGFEVY